MLLFFTNILYPESVLCLSYLNYFYTLHCFYYVHRWCKKLHHCRREKKHNYSAIIIWIISSNPNYLNLADKGYYRSNTTLLLSDWTTWKILMWIYVKNYEFIGSHDQENIGKEIDIFSCWRLQTFFYNTGTWVIVL